MVLSDEPTHFQGASRLGFSLLPAHQLPLFAEFLEVIFEARGDDSEWGTKGQASCTRDTTLLIPSFEVIAALGTHSF